MAARTAAELVIDVTTKADDATSGFDAVASSAKGMSNAVEAAGDTAERTGRQIGISADAADELGGKAGKATGALGALSSGFELVGAEKYAGGLQAASMATDFFSGVGDSLNLVMESTAVKTAIARAQMVAHAIATRTSAAVTKTAAAGQWLLNAAMSANPIGLIVVALIALTAGLVLAYKKSETFREIVSSVGRVGKQAFELITLPTRTLLDVVGDVAGKVKNALPGAIGVAKTAFDRVGSALASPFTAVRDVVQHILDLIAKIKLPKLPSFLGGGGRVAGGGGTGTTTIIQQFGSPVAVQAGPTYNYYFTLNGLVTDNQAADVISELLDRRARQLGAVI